MNVYTGKIYGLHSWADPDEDYKVKYEVSFAGDEIDPGVFLECSCSIGQYVDKFGHQQALVNAKNYSKDVSWIEPFLE